MYRKIIWLLFVYHINIELIRKSYLQGINISLPPGGEKQQCESARLTGGDHEPLDPPDGFPCGHHQHPERRNQPEALLAEPRL